MVFSADSKHAAQGTNNSQARLPKLPRILACASQITGHATPILNVVGELVNRGYDVTFIAGESFQDGVRKVGAKGISLPEIMTGELLAERSKVPGGPERLQWDMANLFLKQMPPRMEVVYRTLEEMREEDPSAEIVIITESYFLGTHPLYLGAPLPKGFTKRPRVVNVHAATYLATSIDAPPFGSGLPPPTTDEERTQNKARYQAMIDGPFRSLIDLEGDLFRQANAPDYKCQLIYDTWATSHDVVLQMCPASLEFPRSDVNPKVKFAGALGPWPLKKDLLLPDFWSEVTAGDKKIIAVTQGTVAREYDHLIMPTMRALADRPDLLVVGVLGSKGSSLPIDFEIPDNARVVDYLPYDAILPYASAFVINAGYGGFIHGVVNGVPMVLAGDTEDKPDVAARGAYAGVGINLQTGSPTEDQLSEAVSQILCDATYKKRVMEIKRENEAMRAMDTVERTVLEMAAMG